MAPDEAATRAKMKEAGYSEEEIQTMIDAGCTEIADQGYNRGISDELMLLSHCYMKRQRVCKCKYKTCIG